MGRGCVSSTLGDDVSNVVVGEWRVSVKLTASSRGDKSGSSSS
jgi:hypothetical protein